MGEEKYLEIRSTKIISPLLSKAFITNINCRKNSTLQSGLQSKTKKGQKTTTGLTHDPHRIIQDKKHIKVIVQK